MNNNTKRLFSLVCILSIFLCGCGKPAQVESPLQDEDLGSYESVLAKDYILVEDALKMLEGYSGENEEVLLFTQRLKDLRNCGDAFADVSEDTGNRYAANVAFYLSNGALYSHVEYSGYMGEILDGEVTDSDDPAYPFKCETQGDLYGRIQDFSIHFSNEALRIQWGGVCDYTLTRGDGSAESVQDYTVPFDETELYESIKAILDENLSNIGHTMDYDKTAQTLKIYVETADGMKEGLQSYPEALAEDWQTLTSSMTEFCSGIYTVAAVGGEVEEVHLYLVEHLRASNSYIENDYLLWIENKQIKYNCIDGKPFPESTPSSDDQASPRSDTTTPTEKWSFFSEVKDMPTPDSCISDITYADQQENDAARFYIYSLPGGYDNANRLYAQYQTLLSGDCGFSLETKDDVVYVKKGGDLLSLLKAGEDEKYGHFLMISFSGISSSSAQHSPAKPTQRFTNKYGTASTTCARPGCNSSIASSGDTNCCPTHSNHCLNCNCYIDGDAMYCMDCLTAAASRSNGSTTRSGSGCTYQYANGSVCGAKCSKGMTLCDRHFNELYSIYQSFVG